MTIMTQRPDIEVVVGIPAGWTTVKTVNGQLVEFIGWLFTGDTHPSDVRVNGGVVTAIPHRDIPPNKVATLVYAWECHEGRDDHEWWYDETSSRASHPGWIGRCYVPVDIDGAIEKMLASAELRANATGSAR